MGSRYGLMVAVAAVFAGVLTFALARHSTLATLCNEFQSLADEVKTASSQSVDERAAVLVTLRSIQKRHCE